MYIYNIYNIIYNIIYNNIYIWIEILYYIYMDRIYIYG